MSREAHPAARDLERIFPGDSEMARRMRAHDWSRTPLGDPARWPMSLRTMVGVMLGNRHPMAVWWTRACLHLYNDAYRPILADKHPDALGGSGPAVWAESWDLIGPMAAGVLDGGPATWDEDFLFPVDRSGFLEETYFTFSYSPIPDDAGGIGGVLVTTKETTLEVQDRRQVQTLRDLNLLAALSKTTDEALERAARVLGENDADVPFALLYAVDDEGERARLVSTVGLEGYDGPGLAPAIALDDRSDAPWPLREALRAEAPVVVPDLRARFGALPGGRWPESPEQAIVLALTGRGVARPYGFVVCGLNPRRRLDERYLDFFRTMGSPISAAITNARAYDEERRRAEALDALDRAKTTFFSNVSHEFRTPLTLMLGPLEEALAAGDAALGARNRERLDLAHRNGLRLLKLVNTLLDFSRIEAGRITASYEATDVCVLTTELTSVFRSAIERAGLSLDVACEPITAPVYLDREMWEKVVLNLLSNAFKFTFTGGIVVTVAERGAEVVVAVRDTGTGIPAEELPHVFERFHRVKGAQGRTHEGTGIGLALVHELVKLHGGTVSVESELGRGTVFTVRLPTGSAHLPAERVRAAGAASATAAAAYVHEARRWLAADVAETSATADDLDIMTMPASTAGARVLVADDNADMRDYVRRLLAPHWTVETVADGEAALASIQRARPDLVLTDVMMPRQSGFALLRAIRENETTRTLPVMLLSARAGEEARLEGLEAGADDYIVKPFSARELVARVHTHLELARLRDEFTRTLATTVDELRAVLDTVPIGIWFARDPACRVIEGNRAATAMLDAAAADGWASAIGVQPTPGVRVFRGGVEVATEELPLQRAVRTGRPVASDEIEVEVGAGRRLTFLIDAVPLFDANGKVRGGVAAAVDLTQRKRHEAKRRRAERAAHESEERFGLIVQSVTDYAIVAIDGDRRVTDWNQGAARLLGYRADEIVGRSADVFFTTEDREREEPAHEARRALEAGRAENERWHVRKEGSRFWGSGLMTPLRDQAGAVRGFVKIFRDMTAAKAVADEREALLGIADKARAEAQAANQAKDEFLAVLSHELRSPMNAMLGWVRILESSEGRDADLVARAVKTLERNISIQAQIISDLLDVSRIMSGKLDLERTRLDLDVVVTGAVESLRPAAAGKHIALRLLLHADDIQVVGDAARLEQVMTNLVGNAIKFTGKGGAVTVSVDRDAACASIVVEDTGQGIAPEFLPHLFERFSQEDSSSTRRHGGLGLGLSIVKNLVALHGGEVQAESEGVGRGTRFRVRLPLASTRTPVTVRAPVAGASAPPSQRPALDVLLVEDDDDTREALEVLLERTGARVRTAASVRQALQAYAARRPDVLLSDIGMPDEDGYVLIRAIREREEGRNHRTLAIAMTGFASRQDQEMALRAGFDEHVGKPVEPAVIFDRMRVLAASRGERDSLHRRS